MMTRGSGAAPTTPRFGYDRPTGSHPFPRRACTDQRVNLPCPVVVCGLKRSTALFSSPASSTPPSPPVRGPGPQPWRSQPESVCTCAQATTRAQRLPGRERPARGTLRAESTRLGEQRRGCAPGRFRPFRRPGLFVTPCLLLKPNTTNPWRASWPAFGADRSGPAPRRIAVDKPIYYPLADLQERIRKGWGRRVERPAARVRSAWVIRVGAATVPHLLMRSKNDRFLASCDLSVRFSLRYELSRPWAGAA